MYKQKYFSAHLKCAKNMGNNCNKDNAISRYSRPIILQVSK